MIKLSTCSFKVNIYVATLFSVINQGNETTYCRSDRKKTPNFLPGKKLWEQQKLVMKNINYTCFLSQGEYFLTFFKFNCRCPRRWSFLFCPQGILLLSNRFHYQDVLAVLNSLSSFHPIFPIKHYFQTHLQKRV